MATAQRMQPTTKPKIEGTGYDRWVTLAGMWTLIGLFVDGWAHINLPQLETFFTPWHAILYSGAATLGGLIVGVVYVNQQRGYVRLSDAIPRGYRLSVIGVPLFFAGALGDLVWHELFGIEVGVEALLSPTHLLLAMGGVLMGGGPMRAAWFRRADDETPMPWRRALPILLSASLLTAVIGFFTAYANPFARVAAAAEYDVTRFPIFAGEAGARYSQLALAFGLAGVLVYAAILSAAVLMLAKRWRTLPFGSFAILVGLPVILQIAIRDVPGGRPTFAAIGLVGGLIADVLYARYQASGGQAVWFRVLAVGAPLGLFVVYFIVVQAVTGGVWWSVHLWAGAAATAGAVGWGMSYLIWPPALDES
jgi:hypothetical protein